MSEDIWLLSMMGGLLAIILILGGWWALGGALSGMATCWFVVRPLLEWFRRKLEGSQ